MWQWFITNGIWIVIAVMVGLVLFYLLRRWARQVMEKVIPKQWQEQLKGVRRITTWVIISIGGVILALAVAGVIISQYGVDITPTLEAVGGWLLQHGIRILIIALLPYLAYIIAKAAMPRIMERALTERGKGRRAKAELGKRSNTLSSALTHIIGLVILIAAIFMLLSEVGIDITPLLAGAGVVGIAIGFGAQGLIKDVLAGFFIMVEDQYNVGDVVRIADVAGGVEGLNLRRTLLRDLDGILHVVPNSEIKVASNFTKMWSRAHLNISVAYKEDLDKVMSIIRKTWEELAEDADWGPFLISKTPWLLRVDAFGDSGIIIKVVGETQPIKQWDVMGELRRRIKKVFDEEGIEIPWPHVKLYLGQNQVDRQLTCRACSHVNLPGNKFCSDCGTSLSSG